VIKGNERSWNTTLGTVLSTATAGYSSNIRARITLIYLRELGPERWTL
jgi:hypothetical protein